MSITQLTPEVAARYKLVHDALTAIEMKARRNEFSRFTIINQNALRNANKHLNTIQDKDGAALDDALAAAEKWVKSVS